MGRKVREGLYVFLVLHGIHAVNQLQLGIFQKIGHCYDWQQRMLHFG